MSEFAIEVQGLCKSFGATQACAELALTVQPQQIVGLVGPDGAGKTTTFRILCGIMSADAGLATVAGFDVARYPEQVKRLIGYLPQRFGLHRDLTIWENIGYVASLYGAPRAQWQPRAQELMEITYLAPFRDRLAGRLSGGMKQKLALLCALIHRPRVLFLDEPTTGVDPISRRDFWRLVYDLPGQDVTVLISTPYMDEAVRCNRIALMYEGRLLAHDEPARLRASSPNQYYEVRCADLRQARALLRRRPEVHSVEVFGDRLHVAAASTSEAPVLRATLAAGGLDCRHVEPLEPSLEDVFMELTRSRQPDPVER